MTEDIYKELAQHLDKMPIGYPPTESGVEIRLLKHVFTPEQAKLATKLSFMPELAKKIYRKVKKEGISLEELEEKLDELYFKGLIHGGKIKNDKGEIDKYYFSAPLVVGIYEYQLNNLTEEYLKDFDQYRDEAFADELNKLEIPQLRIIPIGKSITPEMNVANYDDFIQLIENNRGPISVAECICRKKKEIEGDPCKKIKKKESCLQFGFAAESYHEKGFSRFISKDEALEIVRMAEKKGLVLNPSNSQRPYSMCLCCGCCCEYLAIKRRTNQPALIFATNYYGQVDSGLCNGCGTCERRCQMDAVSLIDEKSVVDLDRCIGCGVCVPTCPEKAMTLKKKDDEIIPPRNTIATYRAIMDKKAELARSEKS